MLDFIGVAICSWTREECCYQVLSVVRGHPLRSGVTEADTLALEAMLFKVLHTFTGSLFKHMLCGHAHIHDVPLIHH